MSQFFAIFKKEIVDNMRDKRTLFFALLYGPVFLPLLLLGPIALGIKKNAIDFDKALTVHMVDAASAPNLVQFLREANVNAVDTDKHFKQKIIDDDIALVLVLSEDYNENFRSGKVATITLHYNEDNDASVKAFRQTKIALNKYRRQLTSMRMQIRGIDTRFLNAIHIVDEDVSSGSDADKFLARILPFIIIMSLTMGGFYLAVDTTAGERERHSLEPLLSLSIPRYVLVLAKFMAVMSFVGMSGALAVISSYLLFEFLPVDELSVLIRIEFLIFAKVFLIISPLIVFFTSAMMMIATFARNTKEAQTHLGFAMIVPMAPFFIIQFMNVKSSAVLLSLPVMSQFLLIERAVTGESIYIMDMFQSVGGSILAASIFYFLTVNMYRRETILKNL